MNKYLLEKRSIWAIILNSKEDYNSYAHNYSVWASKVKTYKNQVRMFYEQIDRLCKKI